MVVTVNIIAIEGKIINILYHMEKQEKEKRLCSHRGAK